MRYIRPSELIAINRELTGDSAVGDEGHGYDWRRLRDATERPQEGSEVVIYDLFPGIHEKAAAFLDSMLFGRPFEKRNDATAVMGLFVFYQENGRELDIDDTDLLEYIQNGQPTFQSLAVYLGRHDAT